MPVPAGVMMAGRAEDPTAAVQVASVDTLAERGFVPPADLVVYDEAHHVVAPTSRGVLAANPQARVLGLTATPIRSDGTGLGDVFERLVTGPSVRELIAEGHLVPCDVVAPEKPGKALASTPAEAWLKHAEGRPGFLFAATIEESQGFVEALRGAGMRASHVDGGTPRGERDAAVEAFRRGDIDVLSSVYVFTEGVDVPRAEVCMLARGCGHAGIYLQMVGRVLRPAPGKARALLIDLLGSVHHHGLPDDDREWSLDGRAARRAEKAQPLTQCPQCGAVWRSGTSRTCGRCGWVMPPPKVLEVRPAALGDVRGRLAGPTRPHASHAERERELRRLRSIAAERGYKRGWVGFQFKQQFGVWRW
jgi:superfamily II DNA or RNA helicase